MFLRSLRNVLSRTETRPVKEKQISRTQAMATENVITMLLQNLDKKNNTDIQNSENDSQNIWTKSLRN